MSQQFQRDAQNLAANVAIPTTTETTVITTNFLTPPFGTYKGTVIAVVLMTVGTGTTAVTVRIRRNPSAENIVLGTAQAVTAVAGNVVSLALMATDSVPDGRSSQYAVTVQQTAATANGTGLAGSGIDATVISG